MHQVHMTQTRSEITMGKILTFLERRKSCCLSVHESKVWQEVKCFDNYSVEHQDTGQAEHVLAHDAVQKKGQGRVLTRSLLRSLRNKVY